MGAMVTMPLSLWWTDPDSGVECRGRIDKAAAVADTIQAGGE